MYCLYKGRLYPTATLHLVADYFGVNLKKDIKVIIGKSVLLQNIPSIPEKYNPSKINQINSNTFEIPIDENGLLFINYINCTGSFPIIPIDIILNYQDKLWKSNIENKILLVGAYSNEIDVHRTPLGEMNGIEVIANAVNTIISKQFFKNASFFENLGTLFFLGILLSIIITYLPIQKALLGVLVILFLFIYENILVFNYFYYQQPIILGILYIHLNLIFQLVYKEITLHKYLNLNFK